MSETGKSWNRVALGVGALVITLGVIAWFDKPDCDEQSGLASNGARRHVALVVDRSGSMEYLVQDVIDNVNAVLNSLQSNDRVSILFFEYPYGVVRYVEDQPVDDVRRLTDGDYFPLGGTPLYDAVGVAIRDVVSPTIGSANASQYGIVIVLSDGEENASVRYSLGEARQAVSAALSEGIDIRFYGMGPAAASEAAALGIPISSTIQVAQSAAGLDEAFDDVQRSLGQADATTGC